MTFMPIKSYEKCIIFCENKLMSPLIRESEMWSWIRIGVLWISPGVYVNFYSGKYVLAQSSDISFHFYKTSQFSHYCGSHSVQTLICQYKTDEKPGFRVLRRSGSILKLLFDHLWLKIHKFARINPSWSVSLASAFFFHLIPIFHLTIPSFLWVFLYLWI